MSDQIIGFSALLKAKGLEAAVGEVKRLEKECERLREERDSFQRVGIQAMEQLAERDALLRELLGCPQVVETATIPRGGIEQNPSQVVVTLHVGLLRLRKVQAALSASAEPSVKIVRAHKHTCANVQPGSTSADVCDCGAMADGKPVEVEPSAPKFGVLAGEPEVLGERCSDGGTCHHRCRTECFRKDCCVPLSGSGLKDDWTAPSAPVERDERAAAAIKASPWAALTARTDAFVTGWQARAALDKATEGASHE